MALTCFQIGSGDIVKFWEDPWLGNTPLKLFFPYPFAFIHGSSIANSPWPQNGGGKLDGTSVFQNQLEDSEHLDLLDSLSSIRQRTIPVPKVHCLDIESRTNTILLQCRYVVRYRMIVSV